MVATAALQEDVDVVGLSILSGAHMTLLPRITQAACDEQGLDDVLVTAGGIIPDDDIPALKEAGVSRGLRARARRSRGRRVPPRQRPTARLGWASRGDAPTARAPRRWPRPPSPATGGRWPGC